ncbi:MAG: response regulator, partial [Paracoccaceae bacterium]
MIKRLSEKSKFELEIIETSTISDTRQALKTETPDFLLLDYRVSDVDVIEFAAEIARQHRYSVPVVVVTGER